MRLPELPEAEQLNEFQRLVYEAVQGALTPVDDSKIGQAQTTFLMDKKRCDIRLTPRDSDSVEVDMAVWSDYIYCRVGGWVTGTCSQGGDWLLPDDGLKLPAHEYAKQYAKNVAETLTQLFSGNIKIKEYRSDGKSYKWVRYDLIRGEWQNNGSYRIAFYNYFGKKSVVEKFCKLY